MKSKKLLLVPIALGALFALAACGPDKSESKEKTTIEKSSEDTAADSDAKSNLDNASDDAAANGTSNKTNRK